MSTDQELEHTDCYLCGNDKPKTLYVIKGFRNNQRSFNVVQCDVCSLVYINPRYSLHENFALYNESYYADTAVDPSGRTRSFLTDRENKINDHKMEVSYIKKYKKEGRILDFGSASGIFLDALDGVWEKYAVDISAFALSHIKDPAVRKFNGTLIDAHYDDNFFDVIYAGHTLDRLIDLKKNIAEMKRILKKDGIILITTPNIGSLCAMLFKENFRLLYSNHLVYFSKETLQKFLDEVGLRILAVKYPFCSTSFFSWRKLPVSIAGIVLQVICNAMRIRMKMPSPPFWGNVMSVIMRVAHA